MENKAFTFSTKVECADVIQDNRNSSQRKSGKNVCLHYLLITIKHFFVIPNLI